MLTKAKGLQPHPTPKSPKGKWKSMSILGSGGLVKIMYAMTSKEKGLDVLQEASMERIR
jgi:hypothetical protein